MTTFALEVKELPGQNPAAAPPPTNPVHNTEAPAWSGDVYQEGDESTPEQTEWSFTGEGGEQAWLDRHDDGTLVAWVREPDGTVYRYTDVDAWAVDVDDAGLQREGAAPAGGELAEGEDPNAVEDPTAGDDYGDGGDVDEDAAFEDYMSDGEGDAPEGEEDPEGEPDGDEPVEDDPADDETDEPVEDEPAEGDTPDDEPEEDDDDENGAPFSKKKKGGMEAKVYQLPYR